jgi:phosphonate transport system substrate-binding protein
MNKSGRHFLMSSAALCAGVALSVLGAKSAVAGNTVKIGMIPASGATQVSVEQEKPLQEYLEKALGQPVKIIIPTNYNATVEGLGNGSMDFAYLGGLTFVKAQARYGVLPVVQRKIDREFHSLFITHAGTKIESIKGLHGKTFAFGDINSTSGHLMPYLAMEKAGFDPDKDLNSYRYTGSHTATAQAVANGVVDAGSLDEAVFRSMVAKGQIDKNKVRIFYTTPAFVDYVWVARKDIDPKLKKKFAAAFMNLKPGRDDKILAILLGKRFVAATNAEYNDIRATAKKLNLF